MGSSLNKLKGGGGKASKSATGSDLPDVVTYRQGDRGKYSGDKLVEKVIVDDEVTAIGNRAFKGCTKLKEVVFSPNCRVKKIEEGAFCGCKALVEVNPPNSLEEIEGGYTGVFDASSNLERVSFGENIKVIGRNAF